MLAGAVSLLSLSPLVETTLNHARLFPENEFRSAALVTVVLSGGFIATIGMIVLGLVAAFCARRRWHYPFAAITFVTAVVIMGNATYNHWQSPPNAFDYFQQVFGSPLPKNASAVRVRGSTPADANVLYYFSCRTVECRALVQQLEMQEITPADGYAQEDFTIWPCPPGWPDYRQWKNRRIYQRRDGKTGRIDSLLCDASGTQVFVYKDPLASKTDSEMNGDHAQ